MHWIMKRFIFYILTVIGICVSTVACSDDKDEDTELSLPPEAIMLEVKQEEPLDFAAIGGLDSVVVMTNAKVWTATCAETWVRCNTGDQQLFVWCLENPTPQGRETFIEVVTGSGEFLKADTVYVKQSGQSACSVAVTPQTLSFTVAEEEQVALCTFKLIDEKSTVSIMPHPEWFTSELKEVNNEQGTAKLVVRVLENDSPDERTCELVVVAGSGVRQAKDTILIEQAGKEIPSKVVLSPDTLSFVSNAGSFSAQCTFVFGKWGTEVVILDGYAAWIKPELKNVDTEKGSAELVVGVDANETSEPRSDKVVVAINNDEGELKASDTIWISQKEKTVDASVSVVPKTLSFAAVDVPKHVQCTFTLSKPDDEVAILDGYPAWIKPELKNVDREKGTALLVVGVEESIILETKHGELTVTVGTGDKQAKATIQIDQEGIGEAAISYTLNPSVFESTGGTLTLNVNVTPARAFTWRLENNDSDWMAVDASQQNQNILKLNAGKGIAIERKAVLILEALGALPVKVTVSQKPYEDPVQGDGYKLGEIVKNAAGKPAGICVREKKDGVPGLIMSLKEFNTRKLASDKGLPSEYFVDKDGEENTKKWLEFFTAEECPDVYAALNEMNSDGEEGWFLPSVDDWWDVMEYMTGVTIDRTKLSRTAFASDYGTEGEVDKTQFDTVNALITKYYGVGERAISLGSYYATSVVGADKYGNMKIYCSMFSYNGKCGANWANTPTQGCQIRLMKKF